jgi:hypothetical protein
MIMIGGTSRQVRKLCNPIPIDFRRTQDKEQEKTSEQDTRQSKTHAPNQDLGEKPDQERGKKVRDNG